MHWWAVGRHDLEGRKGFGPSSRVTPPPATVFSSVLKESDIAPILRHDATASSSVRSSARVTLHLENCRASTSILFFTSASAGGENEVRKNDRNSIFQATKSQRWMPWRQEPMKDVSDCEKLRGAVD